MGGPARPLARILSRIWFRTRHVEGPLPPPGPTLVLLNHPNGLLDPLAAAALLPCATGWLAKATLWKLPPLRPFLAAFQAIPVTRPKDGDATPEAIAQSFRRVHEVLARGSAVALFPEGISHTGADLAPLKTALAALHDGKRVVIANTPPIAERDLSGGEATQLVAELLSAGAQTVAGTSAAVEAALSR